MATLRVLGRRLGRHAAELFAACLATAWFFYLGYGKTLNPTSFEWMLREDWSAYHWGFTFFRNSAWALPLGATPELFWPYGTSVGFTDANPWVSVFFKLLSPILPTHFQFSGLWFLACFVLQAVFGTRITAVFTDDRVRQALGGTLFAVTPLLPSRHPHIALCAFFFLTAGLYFHLAPVKSRAGAKRIALGCIVMLAWAAGTHGYLSVMLLALALTLCARLVWVERVLRPTEGLLFVALCLGTTLMVYYLFGYIGWKRADLTAEGFGQFSGDLTALYNPQRWSRWVDPLPFRPRQWEGFAYLGVGVMALLAVTLLLRLRRPLEALRALGRHWPLLIALTGMWLYSLSSHVAAHGETVLDLSSWYEPAAPLTGIFRSSGRFAWPLHLALIALGVSAVAALKQRTVGRVLLLGAVGLQVFELDRERLDFRPVPLSPLKDPAWEASTGAYRHLAMTPLNLLWVCRYDPSRVNRLSYEAYRRGWTFNSGNFMRKEPGVEALCHQSPSPPDPATIYVVDGGHVPAFRSANFACGTLERFNVCVARDRPSAILKAIEGGR